MRMLVGTHARAHTREHTRVQGTAAATPALLLLNQVPRQRAFEEGAFQSNVDVPGIDHKTHMEGYYKDLNER